MNSNIVHYQSTSPKTVLSDYQKLFSNFPKPQNTPTVVKLNLSWTKFYPAVSTPPWHFEAVLRWLLDSGLSPKNIIPVENRTVVTKVEVGAKNHGWVKIAKKYGVKIHYLTQEKYVPYHPKSKMLVLNQIFPAGILLPQIIMNKPLITLCTLKSHVFTTITGSVKNYFGMLNTNRHFCHRRIHSAIIDLLQIQKELHPEILASMDGSVLGFGPGPRAMEWQPANLILASRDEIALDATAARIIGFDPHQIEFLKLGHRLKLGNIDPKYSHQLPNFHHSARKDTFASRGQKLIYHHTPEWFEKILLRSPITPWSYAASNLYHDSYWYNLVGKPRLKNYLQSDWGKLFNSYVSHA
ncbi:hypothetical protein A3K55_02065 [Candidatus Shapirobacteria bacterium RBG_13_44_7]|uniref:DUF362 domain-containing protein n=1 Tax=Candidatus Shapirobacteria bacterium RBG_13_44_7 TaxID=1802149 RepID=A0A1F7SHH1_9BACT|nr:MAG: hypothetical protein A3K55_02065 [Candidatus Shapirobacteria bacterium RBG_13_44_7]